MREMAEAKAHGGERKSGGGMVGREEEWRGDCSHVVTSVRGSVRIERAGIASALAAAESRDSSYTTRCFFRRGFASERMLSAGSAS